jgi:hypothetical protein
MSIHDPTMDYTLSETLWTKCRVKCGQRQKKVYLQALVFVFKKTKVFNNNPQGSQLTG